MPSNEEGPGTQASGASYRVAPGEGSHDSIMTPIRSCTFRPVGGGKDSKAQVKRAMPYVHCSSLPRETRRAAAVS